MNIKTGSIASLLVLSATLSFPAISAEAEVVYQCKQALGRADSNFGIKPETLRRVEDVLVIRQGNQFLYGLQDGIDSPELNAHGDPDFYDNVIGNVKFAIAREGKSISFFMADRAQKIGVQAYDCVPKPQARSIARKTLG